MTAAWRPDDGELDALARTLPAAGERDADRVEQERTSLLALAAGRPQQDRRAPWLVIAAAGAAFAAAAAVILWLVARPGAPAAPKQTIAGIGPAVYAETQPWPDFIVHVTDGRVAIHVAPLAPGERFRAVTADAEVEVRGTQFIVSAAKDRIASVEVAEGRVELRWASAPPVFLGAGERWDAPRTALREEVPAVEQAPRAPAADVPAVAPTANDASPSRPRPSRPRVTPPAPTSPAPAAVAPAAPRPGETEFRAGVASLRGNDARAAQRSFAAACTAARGSALAEDACFWVGAAAKRANDIPAARAALASFVAQFPRASRANEAAALLGWILYDAGDLDGAERQFARAADDRVTSVRDSAARGLEAIKRTRAR